MEQKKKKPHPWAKWKLGKKPKQKTYKEFSVMDVQVGDVVTTVSPRGLGLIKTAKIKGNSISLEVLLIQGDEKGKEFSQTMFADETVEIHNSEKEANGSEH